MSNSNKGKQLYVLRAAAAAIFLTGASGVARATEVTPLKCEDSRLMINPGTPQCQGWDVATFILHREMGEPRFCTLQTQMSGPVSGSRFKLKCVYHSDDMRLESFNPT